MGYEHESTRSAPVSELSASYFSIDRMVAEFAGHSPLQRFGTPEEVSALAVYLASDESAYTTGAEFNIDGGMLAGTAAPPRPARS